MDPSNLTQPSMQSNRVVDNKKAVFVAASLASAERSMKYIGALLFALHILHLYIYTAATRPTGHTPRVVSTTSSVQTCWTM